VSPLEQRRRGDDVEERGRDQREQVARIDLAEEGARHGGWTVEQLGSIRERAPPGRGSDRCADRHGARYVGFAGVAGASVGRATLMGEGFERPLGGLKRHFPCQGREQEVG
jgi:hypothetical protein